jgi:N-acetyl-anhydromuramyl-L-alanine amidase AmpD
MELRDVRNELPLNPNPRRRYRRRRLKKINKLVLHCTGTGEPNLLPLARYDVTPRPDHHISKKGCPGFTYHYYISKDGTTFFTSDLENITWHAGKHNKNSVGICMKYKSKDNPSPPPDAQLQAAYKILTHLCLELGIDPDRIRGHRELWGTGYKIKNGVKKLRKTCPGMLVNMDKTRYIVSMAVQKVLAQLGYYRGKIDGDFGSLSEAALAQYRKRG